MLRSSSLQGTQRHQLKDSGSLCEKWLYALLRRREPVQTTGKPFLLRFALEVLVFLQVEGHLQAGKVDRSGAEASARTQHSA
jgi:hypothetical protein